MLSNPFTMEVLPVPGAPVTTIFFFPKDLEFMLQSNEIDLRKKN